MYLINDSDHVSLYQLLNSDLKNLIFSDYFISANLKENQILTCSQLQRDAFLMLHRAMRSLSNNEENDQLKYYDQRIRKGFQNLIDKGELIELIDGDTLRIHDKEILKILVDHDYTKLKKFSVISVLGKQSSGKSTLLNNCFGCKFATSSGKCTHGVNFAFRNINSQYKTD